MVSQVDREEQVMKQAKQKVGRMGAGIIVAVFLAPVAWASWAYISPDVQLDEAAAVVVGKMTAVNAEKGTGVIVVAKVIKGDRQLKTVKARFSARSQPAKGGRMIITASSADIHYRNGQEGVWVLVNKDRNGAYKFDSPGLFKNLKRLPEVKARLAALAARKWSRPVKGLSLSILPHQMDALNYQIYVAFKNTSSRPIRVSNYGLKARLTVTLIGPDGKAKELYNNTKSGRKAKMAGPRERNYPEIAPGQVRYIWFRYGLAAGKLDRNGTYQVKVTYKNKDKAERLKLKNVWTGATAAKAKFTAGDQALAAVRPEITAETSNHPERVRVLKGRQGVGIGHAPGLGKSSEF